MGWRVYRWLIMVLTLLVFISHISPAGVDIKQFLHETNSILQWDPYRTSGLIWNGSNVISFNTNSNIAVYNYREHIDIENFTINNRGELFIPSSTAETIRQYLHHVPRAHQRIAAIFIDAGHGGKDPGASAYITHNDQNIQIHEKDIALEVSQLLAAQLEKRYPRKKIILSRNDDQFISLDERTKLANSVRVQPHEYIIFISIHVNASLNKDASGFEVWYLPPDYRRPDLVDPYTVGVTDNDLLSILNTIKEEEYTIESVLLARNVIDGLAQQVGSQSKNRGIKQESWYVVSQAKMPSILIELGFISHEQEALNLTDKGYLHSLTNGIYNGIENFINGFEK